MGISKAHDGKELGPAIEEVGNVDRKIVIEQGVGGRNQKAREIECSGARQRQSRSFVAGRDRSQYRVERLQREIPG